MNGQRVDGAAHLLAERSSTLVMVGNFDGVHLGHQRVLARGLREANERNLAPIALTFDPHPAEVVGRGTRPVLTPLIRKVELLAQLDSRLKVVVEPFTLSLAQWSAEQFAQTLLVSQLGAARVLTGENFRFGKGRTGNSERLRHLGEQHGFDADAEPLGRDEQQIISSTRIRQLLEEGDIESAHRLLGRPHAVTSTVVEGKGHATQLGIPSANLGPCSELLPGRGVYAVRVDLWSKGRFGRLADGVANVGVRPTLGEGEVRLETHLLDFKGDLYGQRIRVHLVRRLRSERHFAGIDELRAQLQQDKESASRALKEDSLALPRAQADQSAWY